jgi:hypothetical protein
VGDQPQKRRRWREVAMVGALLLTVVAAVFVVLRIDGRFVGTWRVVIADGSSEKSSDEVLQIQRSGWIAQTMKGEPTRTPLDWHVSGGDFVVTIGGGTGWQALKERAGDFYHWLRGQPPSRQQIRFRILNVGPDEIVMRYTESPENDRTILRRIPD